MLRKIRWRLDVLLVRRTFGPEVARVIIEARRRRKRGVFNPALERHAMKHSPQWQERPETLDDRHGKDAGAGDRAE